MDEIDDRIEQRIRSAFADVRRADFLPKRQRVRAADDRPVPIGHGQTNSQPTTVRNMLRLLDVRPGQRVLDVGSGSGWTTALLAHLVGPSGRVFGVELVPALAESARENLRAFAQPWASIQAAQTGVLGIPSEGPFDRILVSAQAHSVPQPLVDQLSLGATMVIPVAGRLSVVNRDERGAVDSCRVGYYAFVPLIWEA